MSTKGTVRARAWSHGSRAYLNVGGASVVWIDCYTGPKVTADNFSSEEVRRAEEQAYRDAETIAETMCMMSPEEALRYYNNI